MISATRSFLALALPDLPAHPLCVFAILLLASHLAGTVAPGAWAQSGSGEAASEPLVIPKLDGAIELDGRPDEAAWTEARRLPVVQQRPTFGAEPTEKTEILIGYTDEALYVACRCYDRFEPAASTFERDHVVGDSDYFVLLLDTFNDNENALIFGTTPTGLRTDFSVSGDGDGGAASADLDWDSFWAAEAIQNGEGWFAEMRIPISSLRFQTTEGKTRMGLIAWRFLAREQEFNLFPSFSPKWGGFSHLKVSQARDVVFEDLEPEPPLRVTPYLLGGVGQQARLNDAETAYERQTDPTYDVGLDVKYGLTSNFTLDLTVNTDFAQVEADDQQVNLTRFPLFFPEKRRFFLERASNFSFGFGRANRLFYSRRIGLFEGQQVRILGGARVVGRSGPWDVGVLSMQTAREPEIGPGGGTLPSENFGVVRVQREVFNEDSNVGGIVASRIGRDGTYNVAYGLDGRFRLEGETYLTAKWAQTFQDGAPNRVSSLDPARVHLQWEDRAYEGLGYDLRYDRAGPRYAPSVGLELREDYFRLGDRIGYGWIPGEGSPIQRHQLNLEGEAYFRNADGTLQSLELGPEWTMTTNTGHELTLEASRRVEDLRRAFPLGDEAEVPAGRYGWQAGEISYEMPSARDLRAGLELTGGGFYDGWRATAQVSPTWNASRYLRLSGFYQLNRIGFPERGQRFTAHVGRLRVEVTPSVEYAIAGFLQYNSARGVVVGNVRFRYNPRQGTDLYLVYNERLNTDRSGAAGPRLPLSGRRTLLLKYTYTFNW